MNDIVKLQSLPITMEHQADEKDDEQMVCVPEHLKIRPADDLHGGSDDEYESQRDDHTCQPGNGGEHDNGWALHQKIHFISLVCIKSRAYYLSPIKIIYQTTQKNKQLGQDVC